MNEKERNIIEQEYEQRRLIYEQITNINNNILYLQEQNKQEIKHLKEIQFNTSFIAIIIFLYVLIRIILLITGINIINNI